MNIYNRRIVVWFLALNLFLVLFYFVFLSFNWDVTSPVSDCPKELSQIVKDSNKGKKYEKVDEWNPLIDNQCYCKGHKIEKNSSFGGETIQFINGIVFPMDTKSFHFRLPLCGERLGIVHKNLHAILRIFHRFAEENKMIYTLSAGNLIAYLRDDEIILPHDDDIDLIIGDAHWAKLDRHWDEAFDMKLGEDQRLIPGEEKPRAWVYRLRYMYGHPVVITRQRYQNGHLQGIMYKWTILTNESFGSPVVSSIDLLKCGYDKSQGRCKHNNREIGPNNTHNEADFPVMERCGTKFRVYHWDTAMEVAVRYYGKIALENKLHPKYQDMIKKENE